ncbi:hypothetical protein JTE90_008915 [Oedothorax gibbosus]|uniref:Uncharacterized protein n=1 Tax=Oedothorax gibbosus TaxID=931172 RepID=A0AAV6UK57_9ARAC|nr:hypothetical protein JTE90_008915 [Oedothorax gibbosus]
MDRDYLVVQAATRRPRVMSTKPKSKLVLKLALFLVALTGLAFLAVAVVYLVFDLQQKRFVYLYIGLFLVLEGVVIVISFWPKACQVLRPKSSMSQAQGSHPVLSEDLIENLDGVEPSSEVSPHTSDSAPHILERHVTTGI